MNLLKRFRYTLPIAAILMTTALSSCGQLTRCHPVTIDGHTVCTTLTRPAAVQP